MDAQGAALCHYFPGTPRMPRVAKSVRVSSSRIASHSRPPNTTNLVSFVLWRRCMKNSATRSIFTHAIPSATTVLNAPRSTRETAVVTAVSEIDAGDRGGHSGRDQQRQQDLYVGSDGIDMSLFGWMAHDYLAHDYLAHDYLTRWRSIR